MKEPIPNTQRRFILRKSISCRIITLYQWRQVFNDITVGVQKTWYLDMELLHVLIFSRGMTYDGWRSNCTINVSEGAWPLAKYELHRYQSGVNSNTNYTVSLCRRFSEMRSITSQTRALRRRADGANLRSTISQTRQTCALTRTADGANLHRDLHKC